MHLIKTRYSGFDESRTKKGGPTEAVINNAMDSFVTKCEAEADLEAKIIRFPKR